MQPKHFKQFLCFLTANGKPPRALPGILREFDPPEIKRKTATYRAGDVLAERKVKMGLEPMAVKLTFDELPQEVLDDFGICDNTAVRVRIVASADGNCEFEQHEWVMDGAWDNVKQGKLKAGDITTTEAELEIEIYQYLINNAEKLFVDFSKGIERANGVDITANTRANLDLPY